MIVTSMFRPRPVVSDETPFLIGAAGIAPIAAGVLLMPLRPHLAVANLAILLMAVVVLAALIGGRAAGAVAAITATMSFDFFLTRPYLTMRITSRDDIETAAILLVVGTLVGQFAARSHATRTARDMSRSELSRLHRMAELAASDAEPDRVVDAGRRELTELLDLHECRFERAPYTPRPRLNRDGTIERPRGPIMVTRLSRQGFEMPAEGLELTVVGGGRSLGRYVLVPRAGQGLSVEQGLVAVALVDQVGHALHAASFTTAPPAAGR